MTGLHYTGQFPPTNAADPVAEAANRAASPRHRFSRRRRPRACLTFALTDGVVPSNEGRGYVLRRILRRAVRFGRQTLGLHDAFLHKLVPLVVETMGEAFPELKKNPQRVMKLIEEEEISFGRTLDRGMNFQRFSTTLRFNSECCMDSKDTIAIAKDQGSNGKVWRTRLSGFQRDNHKTDSEDDNSQGAWTSEEIRKRTGNQLSIP